MLKTLSKKKKLQINIIPLIDIIFLMLVFFMLATNFSKNKEISFSINNQKKVINETSQKELMMVFLKDKKIFFDDKEISLKDLEEKYLKKWNSLNYEKIILLNDDQSTIQLLISVLDLIKKNNIKDVNFANEPEKNFY
ncbi:MAG: biopolymer transporter ExbD [Pseudomonadota bacterium]|nr:biopolymer transporter ExbD [Pseudomonadota bacterium]